MQLLKGSHLSRSFSYLSIAQGINAASSFAVMTIFTRSLPTEEYGRVSMLWLLMTIMAVFIDFRLNAAFCIRFYKVSKEENTRNLYSIVAFNIFVAICMYFIWCSIPGTIARLLKIPVTSREIVLVSVLNLTMVVAKLFTSLLLVTRQAKHFFWSALLSALILIPTCLFLLFELQVGYHSYFYGHLAAYGMLALIGLFYIWRKFPPTAGSLPTLAGLKALTRLSLPLIPDAFLMMLLASAGRYFLNIYHGLAMVAVYSVSYMFGSVFNALVLGPFGQAITPVLYEKYASSQAQYSEYLSRVFKYYWVALASLILGCFVCFREVFPWLVTEKYVEALNIIVIIMLGMLVYGGASLLSCTIVLKEKTHLVFFITLVSVAANIGTSLLLIPPWGLYGAALASFFGYLLQGVLITFYTQRMVYVDLQSRFLLKFLVLVALTAFSYLLVAQLSIPSYYQISLKLGVYIIYLFVMSRMTELKTLLLRS